MNKPQLLKCVCVMCHLQECWLGELQPFLRSRQSWEAGKLLSLLIRQRFSVYPWKIRFISVPDSFSVAEGNKRKLTKSALCHVTYPPAFSVKHTA